VIVELKAIFFLSIFLIAYVYVAYPLIIFTLASFVQAGRDLRYVLSRTKRRALFEGQDHLPAISIVIAVFNEEQVIEERIKNCLSLDYPREKMEIIVASDGSTDQTNGIVEEYAGNGVRLLAFDGRNGKSFVLNRAIPEAKGSILLLTDSNTFYESDAILKLIRHFDDPTIGGVCGELRVTPSDDATVEESLYWKFENTLKFMESRLNMTLGANGGIYAIRADAFMPIPDGTIVDDFIIFLNVRRKGFKTIFDPEAVAYERSAPSLEDEYKRKTRIGAGDLQAIRLAGSFLHPKSGAVCFSLWSHKVLRWAVPFFLITLFLSNLALAPENLFFLIVLTLQLIFYALFVIGFFYRDFIFLKIPYYFMGENKTMRL
jgi:cellulose synthase/poly-beta-1,6-N-acetylglucosamine synthase-like glycosyltransferase